MDDIGDETMYTRDEMIKNLAEVLSGLMVPLSISGELGRKILGAADEPYRNILGDFNQLGYPGVEEWESYLRQRLVPTYQEHVADHGDTG